MKKLLAMALILSLFFALPALAELGSADVSFEGTNYHLTLDSIEIDNLLNIADNSIGTAGAQAKGILEFAYGYHFYNCIDPEEQGMKSRKYLNTAATENIFGIEITAKPNPANAWVAFNYTLPANNPQGVIKISNLSGKEIASIPVSGKQGQQIWDIRSVKPGVYFYTLNTAGLSRHGKIVISK